MIIDYKFIYHGSHVEAERLIKEAIKEGWQPFGQPMLQPGVGSFVGYSYFTQVMVKHEKRNLSGD